MVTDILLIASNTDPHTQIIAAELSRLNQRFIVLEEFTFNDSFVIQSNNQVTRSTIVNDKGHCDTQNLKSIWNSSSVNIRLKDMIPHEMREFTRGEWEEGIVSLWSSIPATWVNDPIAVANTTNRLRQLNLAKRVGFHTPSTLITNDGSAFLDFYERCGKNIVAKTLHGSLGVGDHKMIFTTKISDDDLDHAADLRFAPCMFQEYVPKKTELRITIIGGIQYPVEIHSQKSILTLHDWRRYDDFEKTPYVKAELPNDISKKISKLMRLMNLNFGAVDLILTPNDDFVFLEVNANGRWLWIQELTGMNIARGIAQFLSKPENSDTC